MKKEKQLAIWVCVHVCATYVYHYDGIHICDDVEYVCDGTVLRMRQNLYSYGLLCIFEAYQYIRTSISD